MPFTGDTFFDEIEQRVTTNVGRAGTYLALRMKARININCPAFHLAEDLGNMPGRHPGAAIARGKLHSPVGGPPYLETANLYHSVHSELEDQNGWPVALVGTDVMYGLYLEKGTMKMGSRPWILSTLNMETEEIVAQVCAPADIGGSAASAADSGAVAA